MRNKVFKKVIINGCEFRDVVEMDGWLYIASDVVVGGLECVGSLSEATAFWE